MLCELLADAVLLVHVGFVVLVVAGGAAVLRWPRLAWVHVPAVIWGALIEYAGWICPLTPLENTLRQMGGGEGYAGGFIDHYVSVVLYPAELTRSIQMALGTAVVVLNAFVYWRVAHRKRRHTA